MGSNVFVGAASGFIVYYSIGATGFISPTWNDYPAVSVSAPTVATGAASAVTTTGATLNGAVNPNAGPTTALFEYGLTPAYGSVASVTLLPANGFTMQFVSASLGGLQAGQTYHYRLVATNLAGTSAGEDRTLATLLRPPGADEAAAPGLRIVGGVAELTVAQSITGWRYQVQQSDTLEAGSWINVGPERIGAGGPLVIQIPHAPELPRRFYRLVLGAPSP
jgi:hypothetical protein